MSIHKKDSENYVLAYAKDDGSLAILCRTEGNYVGPATCSSKKDAIKLKTSLANDQRAAINNCAMAIIKSLLIYKVESDEEPLWDGRSLWAYLPQSHAKCMESQSIWNV